MEITHTQRFNKFINDVLTFIPDRYKSGNEFQLEVERIRVCGEYAAPEVIWQAKQRFCDLLTQTLPVLNPPAPWQTEIVNLIQTVLFVGVTDNQLNPPLQ